MAGPTGSEASMGLERVRRRARDVGVARFAGKLGALYKNRESVRQRPAEAARYLMRSREISNWTYELENEDEVLTAVARLVDADPLAMKLYRDELRGDTKLRDEIDTLLAPIRRRDPGVRYGYRIMHYCLVRVMKPETVVELGVHDGLDAAVVLRALERNTWEGRPGLFLGFDIYEESGWLIPEWLKPGMDIHIGDASVLLDEVLPEQGVDLLIQDIGPGIDTETKMFESALRHSKGPLVIRGELDDSENVGAFAKRHRGRYVSVQERPKDHFWMGTKIGLAVFDPHLCGEPKRQRVTPKRFERPTPNTVTAS